MFFPADNQIWLLDHFGFKHWYLQSNITKDPIISSDSFLGVKYFIEKDKITENPYALPLVFSSPNTSAASLSKIIYSDNNTFKFQNALYRELSGLDKDIYSKANFTREIRENEIIYHIDYKKISADTNAASTLLFASIFADKSYSGVTLYDGDKVKTNYLTQVSPSVVKLNSNTLSPSTRFSSITP